MSDGDWFLIGLVVGLAVMGVPLTLLLHWFNEIADAYKSDLRKRIQDLVSRGGGPTNQKESDMNRPATDTTPRSSSVRHYLRDGRRAGL